jgi:hypothetical protein
MRCNMILPATAGMFLSMISACGPVEKTEVKPVPQTAVTAPAPKAMTIVVDYSLMADLLNMIEGVSLWRTGMPRTYRRAFDDLFGLDGADKELLRKFAFARSELLERSFKGVPAPTFEAPFGPEGLMPKAALSPADKFWTGVLSAGRPDKVAAALAGLMAPADSDTTAKALTRFAPRLGELTTERAGFGPEVKVLTDLIKRKPVFGLLNSLAAFAGKDTAGLHFDINPVWGPEGAALEAIAHGDRILVAFAEGSKADIIHACLALHEIGRRLLGRMPAAKKALATIRFVERAGHRGDLFELTEGILDAFSHGIVAPLLMSAGGKLPPWPGDERRRKFGKALVPLLRDYLSRERPLDGKFALQAAEIFIKSNPARPADFLGGGMVIGGERAIGVFKSQVVRWTVWKFPVDKKYNYPRKFADYPGRSVLLLFTPDDLRSLPKRFKGYDELISAMRKAQGYMQREQAVLISVPRRERGYFFLMAAPSAEKMKKIAQLFFKIDHIPTGPVTAD